MKQIFIQQAAYNLWANTQFANIVKGITPSYFEREIESSFPSIRKTINHIRGAEHIWLSRLQGPPINTWPPYATSETPQEVADGWLQGSQALLQHIHTLSDSDFSAPHAYQDLSGKPQEDQLNDMLMHIFNHATFHRGQLVTLFRQSGIQTIPRTDYIAFVRG